MKPVIIVDLEKPAGSAGAIRLADSIKEAAQMLNRHASTVSRAVSARS